MRKNKKISINKYKLGLFFLVLLGFVCFAIAQVILLNPANNSVVYSTTQTLRVTTNLSGFTNNVTLQLWNSTNSLINTSLLTTQCYQETTNISSAVDTLNCGLNYSGNYSWSGGWRDDLGLPAKNEYDGNFLTFERSADDHGNYIYINYIKPANALSSTKVRISNSPTILGWNDHNVPTSCWNRSPTVLSLRSVSCPSSFVTCTKSISGVSELDCLNSSNQWEILGVQDPELVGVGEEAVLWSMYPSNHSNNKTNYSIDISLPYYDTYHWNVIVNNGSSNIASSNFTFQYTNSVASCGTLSESNVFYNQTQNISIDQDFCITITGNNVTYNGNGFMINSTTTGLTVFDIQGNNTLVNQAKVKIGVDGVAFNIANSNKNVTINNSVVYGGGVYVETFEDVSHNIIINNNTLNGNTSDFGIIFVDDDANGINQFSIISNNRINNQFPLDIEASGINITNNVIDGATDDSVGFYYNNVNNNYFAFNNITQINDTSSDGVIYVDEAKNTIFEKNWLNISSSLIGISMGNNGYNDNGTVFKDQYLENYLFLKPSTLTIKNTGIGQISFFVPVNGTGANFSKDVQIKYNFVQVNSSQTGINKSANITLYGLPTFVNPVIIRNGIYRCTPSTSPSCYNYTSLNAGTVIFNVSSWSNYTIGEYVLTANLTNPLNNSITNSTNNFTVSINASLGAQNITLNIYNSSGGLVNQTTTSPTGFFSGLIGNVVTLLNGVYNWFYTIFDFNGNSITTNTYTLIVNSTVNITITNPVGTQNYLISGQNQTINWTISNPNSVSSCWYSFNGGPNITLDCNSNSTQVTVTQGSNNLIFYANDTLGNIPQGLSLTWDYYVFQKNISYAPVVLEGDITNINGSFTLHQSPTNLTLMYNGTGYVPSLANSGSDYIASANTIVPLVSIDSNTSFYFSFNFGPININTTTLYQNISNIQITSDCNASNYVLVNMSMYDEDTQRPINGTIDYIFNLLSNSNQIVVLNGTITTNTSTALCSVPNLNSSSLLYSLQLRYYQTGGSYFDETYNIIGSSVQNFPFNIPLYLLNRSSGYEFKINYVDFFYLTHPGATITMQRQYIPENKYKAVEIPIISSEGYALGAFNTNNIKYKAIVMEHGQIIDIFENLFPQCQNAVLSQCELNLRGVENVSTTTSQDLTYTLTQNDTNIVLTYAVPSGTPRTISLSGSQSSRFLTNISTCSISLFSSSGTLNCAYNNTVGDSLVSLQIDVDGDSVASGDLYIAEDLSSFYLLNNYFIAFVLLLTLILMFASSATWMAIISVVGLIYLGVIFLLKGVSLILISTSILWLLIAVILAIYKFSQKEDTT